VFLMDSARKLLLGETLDGHTDRVCSLQFLQGPKEINSRFLVTAGADGLVILWDINSRKVSIL